MNKNELTLIRVLLKSTSSLNLIKYSKDKKKKNSVIGNLFGMAIIYLMLLGYGIATCIGYNMIGMTGSIPSMCALSVSSIAFIFTIFKTNGYLFAFKEYDMLMAMPFPVSAIARAKFSYMYIKSLPWYMSISVAMMIGFGIGAHPSWYIYPLWLVLSLILPVIPMLAASFIGYLIARCGSGFKHTKVIQMILTFAFIPLAFSSRFIIEAIFKNGKLDDTLNAIADTTSAIGSYYPPVEWFSNSVLHFGISDILLLVGVSLLLFEVVFIPVSRSYRKINSALKSNSTHKKFTMQSQKKRNPVFSIAFKEFKRMTGSSVYMTNVFMGEVFALIIGIASLFFDFDSILAMITQNAPVTAAMVVPAIPMIIYFFIGMVPSTTCSPSLEGKNYWIVQSLPIEKKTLYKGKILFNILLTVPFTIFATVCVCFSAKAGLTDSLLCIILGIVLCIFSSCFGCVCGIKYMKLEWENDIEVVKQGTAVVVYLFPNMFVTMALLVGSVFLGFYIASSIVLLIMIALYALLSWICYLGVVAISRKN